MCDKIAARQGGLGGLEAFYMGFQHLFRRLSTARPKEAADITETFKTLIDSRIDRLESNFVLLRAEWNDTYEKISLLYDRNRKRLKAIEKASEGEETIEPAQGLLETGDDVLRLYTAQNGG